MWNKQEKNDGEKKRNLQDSLRPVEEKHSRKRNLKVKIEILSERNFGTV